MNSFVSRAKRIPLKGKSSSSSDSTVNTDKRPQLADFLKSRDYTGALVLLEFQRATGESNSLTLPLMGFCAFHLGDYERALNIYKELLEKGNSGTRKDKEEKPMKSAPNSENPFQNELVYHLYQACCLFYLGRYKDSEREALLGPNTKLQNRILFHAALKQNDESKIMQYHAKVSESTEDQLSLAAVHYARNHFQEATDIYKKLLIEYRDYLALQVYVSMCYYKLDYYDVSLELLAPYLAAHPDSAIAVNLKACNHFKLYDGKAAEAELKSLMDLLASSAHNFDSDLIRHNLVVFRTGENALQILPPLVDIIPEAKLNLIIYYLRHNEVQEAFNLIKDIEPSTPQEYILKGVVHAAIGQTSDSKEHLKLAQNFFQLVGASASECDTIPGRMCMASCFFLLKQFEDVLIYLNSIKTYCLNDSTFNYDYGLTLGSCEQYKEAEEALLLVTDELIRSEYVYLSWLARCFIMNGKPREAWELYLKMESSTDSFSMLLLIGNECYKVGSFYFAAKAFDVLERLDPSPEYWEGKRGACCGIFQAIVAKREKKELLRDVVIMLRSNQASPQAELIVRIMRKWATENGLNIP
jgi:intraflagellar transport protein 56